MRLAAECRYNMVIVTLSALLAVLASFVGLWLSFHFRDEAEGVGWQKILGAVVAGSHILDALYGHGGSQLLSFYRGSRSISRCAHLHARCCSGCSRHSDRPGIGCLDVIC